MSTGAFANICNTEGGCTQRTAPPGIQLHGPWQIASLMRLNNYQMWRPFFEIGAHTAAHYFVGGDFERAQSPSDPAFFLLHSNVDRLFAQWQECHNLDQVSPSGLTSQQYSGLGDYMLIGLSRAWTPRQLWNIAALGYSYVPAGWGSSSALTFCRFGNVQPKKHNQNDYQ